MLNILRNPDDVRIMCEEENVDAKVRYLLQDRKLNIYVTAQKSKPTFICLRWNYKITKPSKILGDRWERSYSDLEWRSLNGEYFMPWYFLLHSVNNTVGCGVMVQPNSFVSFQCDASGVTAWFDVRCGAKGVELDGRELLMGSIVCEQYSGISAFEAAKQFCKVMSPNPRLPKNPVYGSNNWYYAYGKSSFEDIVADAKIIAELTEGNENRPFMVIDSGWEVNSVAGPWRPNERYGDMKKVSDAFRKLGVRPGIWFRPLHDIEAEKVHVNWLNERAADAEGYRYLDPSHPEVREHIRKNIRDIKSWGFELIKHDFSTYDSFGGYGRDLNGKITTIENWAFHDRKKTSAEIILDFYRLIREEAGDMIVIGCNTVSHLSAGLVEISRTGDDTSGRHWSRTRALGVNTLAFRLCQNEAFYVVDADCVGILDDNIDWKLNKQWLHLLANSGTPLFVSAQPKALTDEIRKDLKKAFVINAKQKDVAEPLDWEYNNEPQQWNINGQIVTYDFVMDSYPQLLSKHTQPY